MTITTPFHLTSRFGMTLWAAGTLLLAHAPSPIAAQGSSPRRPVAVAGAPPGAAAEAASADAGHGSVEALVTELLHLLERGEFRRVADQLTVPRLQERLGRDELARAFRDLRDGLGRDGDRFPLARLVTEGDGEAWVHVRSAEGGENRFRIFHTREAPYLLRGVQPRVRPAVTAAAAPPEAWPELIRAFVDQRAAEGRFSGTVAVGRHGMPIFAAAWGLADAATGRRMTPETPVNIGSMNKMFTGLALAQLAASGRLAFGDTVGRFLPDYPNATVRHDVTIHQLLTHTAGIPGYWNAAHEASRDTLHSVAGFAATFNREPLLFAPGTSWQYSNGGPVVAGQILEAVTGTSYYDYMREHVYGPAGMTHTDHYQAGDTLANVAVGYGAIVDGGLRDPNTAVLGRVGSPAGGGYSTVLDLVRFAGALASGALLPPEALATVWSPPRTGAESDRYGYLWGSGAEAGQRWVGHNGGGPGISADFRYFPESGYVIVVLSNLSEAAMPVSEWLTSLVARGSVLPEPTTPTEATGTVRPARADSAAVRQVALDYLEGWFTGDPSRMARALHPDLVKRRVVGDRLEDLTRDRLTAMAPQMAGGPVPAGLADGVTILDLTATTAIVRLDAPGWVDWLVVARIGGGWRIVQVHWEGKGDHSGGSR